MVELCIPQFDNGLALEPLHVHEQRKYLARLAIRNRDAGDQTYHTSFELGAAGFLGGLDDLSRDDGAVGAGDLCLLELARDTLSDEVAEAQADLGHVECRDGRVDILVAVVRKHWIEGQELMLPSR